MRNEKSKIWKRARAGKQDLISLAADHLQNLNDRNYSTSTYNSRKMYLGFFLLWCDKKKIHYPTQVTRQLLENYALDLSRHYSKKCRGMLSYNSRRLYLLNLKLFFKWLKKKNHLLYDPSSEIELGHLPKQLPRKVLTREQVEAIINAADVKTPIGLRDRAIMETFYSTGIRAKELMTLQVNDINPDRGTLVVRQGKGNKDRFVPIGSRALAWIKKYLPERQPKNGEKTLFLTQYGKAFTNSSTLSQIVTGYMKTAIDQVGGCHAFRHAMATTMLENGASVRYIKEILGHSDVTTTSLYTKVSISHLCRVHARNHPAENAEQKPIEIAKPKAPYLAAPIKPRGRERKLDKFWSSPPQSSDDFLTLGNYVLEQLKLENYSRETIQAYRGYLKHFVTWCHKRSIFHPAKVSQSTIEQYRNHLTQDNNPTIGKPISPASRRNKLGAVSTFFRRLVKKEKILHDPTATLDPIKCPKQLPKDPLTHFQAEHLLAQPNLKTTKGIRDRAILETIYSTGLRRREIAKLEISDINFTRGTILVRQGKGNKDRYVPIGDRALNWLEIYLEKARPLQIIYPDQKALFLSKEGKPLDKCTVSLVATQYFKAAGLQGSCHTLRHTMASLLLEQGVDLRHIQEILGHKSLSTTDIYTHVTIATLKEIHNRTHPAQMHPTLSPKILEQYK